MKIINNQSGIAHLVLIVGIVFALIFGVIGATYIRMTDAAVTMVNVGTYNLRSQRWDGQSKTIPNWAARKSLVQAYITAEKPGIIGMQEVIAQNPDNKKASPQRSDVVTFMNKLGYYGQVGSATNSSPLFWRSANFTQYDAGEVLIYNSATSKRVDPPASRFLTYARLNQHNRNETIMVFNYHFNQFEQQSAQLNKLGQTIATIYNRNKQDSLVLTGDLNGYHGKIITELKKYGITLRVSDGNTTVDHVLISKNVAVRSWTSSGPGSPPASDHPLIVSKLSL